MPQSNDAFIKKTFETLGFGEYFHQMYQEGKNAKLPEIPFDPGVLNFGDRSLVILPKVVAEPKLGDDFYVMKGWQATRVEEGKPDVTQFLPQYKTIGMNADQADKLLAGAAVRHLSGWKDNEPQFAFSQINFTEKTENDNFKIMKRPDDGSLVKTLGQIGIIGKKEEKDDIFQRIQNGERIPVNVREGDSSKRMNIQMAVRKTGPGVDLMDNNGIVVKQYPQSTVRMLQPLKAVGEDKKINEATLKTLTQATDPKIKPEKKKGIA